MQKVYILDTNTLIENPDCLEAFRNGQENKVLIPYSVIMELDRLKTRPDLTHIIALVPTGSNTTVTSASSISPPRPIR